jgi:hypothetical protein
MSAGENNRIADGRGLGDKTVTRECGVSENIPYMQEIFLSEDVKNVN